MRIDVEQCDDGEPMVFHVTVREGCGKTRHRVTMTRLDYQRLSGGRVSPAALVRAAFAFLLEREPKEAILARFDITVISRYFPEFERTFPASLPQPETSKP